jgi:N6-adenosine-specific RNA methylase IME4
MKSSIHTTWLGDYGVNSYVPNAWINQGFSVIYADPPWSFKTFSAKGTGRSAISHFDTMSLEQLRSLPVGAFAARDCALLLWVVRWLPSRAIADLLDSWDFVEKGNAFTYVKTTKDGKRFPIGCGYSTRANPERCILATRGKPKVLDHGVPELIIAPRREHSRKPEIAYEYIERLYAGPYLELFSRNTRKGWASWGNETDLFDNGPVKTRRQPSDLTGLRT